MYCKTDKHVTGDIWVSSNALNTRPGNTRNIVNVIIQTLPAFKKLLNLGDVKFRITKFKNKNMNGRYIRGSGLVEISPKLDIERALVVLAHELVHAEQYNTGRLRQEWTRQGWTMYWNNNQSFVKGSTYLAYRNLPWEKEAFGREKELAEKVLEMTYEKKPNR
jgi:hypothetical protein